MKKVALRAFEFREMFPHQSLVMIIISLSVLLMMLCSFIEPPWRVREPRFSQLIPTWDENFYIPGSCELEKLPEHEFDAWMLEIAMANATSPSRHVFLERFERIIRKHLGTRQIHWALRCEFRPYSEYRSIYRAVWVIGDDSERCFVVTNYHENNYSADEACLFDLNSNLHEELVALIHSCAFLRPGVAAQYENSGSQFYLSWYERYRESYQYIVVDSVEDFVRSNPDLQGLQKITELAQFVLPKCW